MGLTSLSTLIVLYLSISSICGAKAGVSLDKNTQEVVSKAVNWILRQRQADGSWGSFTPRAIVALTLAQEAVSVSKDEMDIMTKQLNILLSLELDNNLSTERMALSRLALYVNALYATCQNPRNFHGLDLIRALRSRTDATVANVSGFSLPIVYLPLCLLEETRYQDVRVLNNMYQHHKNKTVYFRRFAVMDKSKPPASDEALNSNAASPEDVKSLVSLQSPDGSFGSLLGTYYALPALLGKNLLTLKDRRCNVDTSMDHFVSSPLSESGASRVHYSVWLGEGDDKDSYSLTLPVTSNISLFDIMQMAQTRNPNFKFNYEETSTGKSVYSLSGVPNDVQRELYWTLYLTKDNPNGLNSYRSKKKLINGVDRIYPAPEDHYIFWFQRRS
ncbi:uncharacterized protein NPIL_543491 [Nephila pilipes]|uniref:Uncharacterized protein n=1 Tax=Nephila pilipes TaxID=299642 RepID=A0A8X6T4M3_NEPPI|nr:uncharacterized protein NPIL_543491 [Nephila pilipes]